MSALEDILFWAKNWVDASKNDYAVPKETVSYARAELAQLRAKASEYERIADLIDPNDAFDHIPISEQVSNMLHDESSYEPYRIEIAALRAQVETAREIMTDLYNAVWAYEYIRQAEKARAWLAANAPQEPKEDQTDSLRAAIREVRSQLRATQRNWDEDCLFRADAILTRALGEK